MKVVAGGRGGWIVLAEGDRRGLGILSLFRIGSTCVLLFLLYSVFQFLVPILLPHSSPFHPYLLVAHNFMRQPFKTTPRELQKPCHLAIFSEVEDLMAKAQLPRNDGAARIETIGKFGGEMTECTTLTAPCLNFESHLKGGGSGKEIQTLTNSIRSE